MNKVIFGLILAVCILGMGLIMLNERLGRKPESQPAASTPQIVTEKEIGLPPASPKPGEPDKEYVQELERKEEMDRELVQAREFESEEAREALSPPPVQDSDRIPASKPDIVSLPPIPEEVGPREIVEPARPAPPARKPEAVRQPQASASRPAVNVPAQAAKPDQKPPKPKPEAPKKAEQNTGSGNITRFVVFSRENGATIRIGGDKTMNYKSITLDNPDRLVIDIDGDWKFPPRLEVPKNALVNTIRVGKNGDKTRLVIDLKEKPRVSRFIPTKKGDSLDVRIDK